MDAVNDPNDDPVVKKRKPWLAALLSLLAPGMGQLYNGGWISSIVSLLLLCTLLAVSKYSIQTAIGMSAVFLAAFVRIGIIVEAFVSARRQPEYALKRYNRIWWYIGFAIVAIMLTTVSSPDITIGDYKAYIVPTGAMKPTIVPGDRIVADMRNAEGVHQGMIVVFRSPYDGKILLKRCVAVERDTVEVRHKVLIVNGKPADEPFVQHDDDNEYNAPGRTVDPSALQDYWAQGKLDQTYWARDNLGPVVVPPGHLFMMGDNRDNSFDSRFWGPLDQRAVIGKPLYVYFSNDIKRIGMKLR